MKFELTQEFYFEAAHTLERKVETEASRRVHGHTYHAEVTIVGERDPQTGMVMDLALLRAKLAEVRDQLDHRLLDDVAELGRPTLENLCNYIWEKLSPALPGLDRVTVLRRASGDRCTRRH